MKVKFTLSLKITLVISLALIITLSIVGYYLFDHYSNISLNNLEEVSRLQAESLTKDISNIFENAKIATDYLSKQISIIDYLSQIETRQDIKGHKLYNQVLETLDIVTNSNDRHFLTWIANEKVNFYLDNNGYVSEESYDVKKRPWYSYALASDGVALTPPYVEWSTKKVVISSIKTIKEDDQIVGFVVVDIELSDLPEMLNLMKQGQGDLSYLISGDGTYIHSQDQNNLVDSNMFDDNDNLSGFKDKIIKGDGSINLVEIGQKSYYLIAHTLDERGWIVVTLIDANRINQAVHSKDSIVFTILIIGLLCMFISLHILIRFTTKPYRTIVDYGADIASGNISRNIPSKYLHRKDEMGALSNSFQSIINTFRNINLTLEDEITKKNKELENQFKVILEQEKYASLGMIVTGIAHEINTPIGSCLSVSTYLLNKAEILKEKFESGKLTKDDFLEYNDTEYHSLEIINDSLIKASNIIENFKTISVNHDSEKIQNFNLRNILDATVLSLNTELSKTKHEIMINCNPDLCIDSYPGGIIQVISHLLMNTLKHGFEDMQNGCITIEVSEIENSILIDYKDDGKGIVSEDIEKIYEPFYTTCRGKGCSGLGMYVVYTLVTQKLGGTIECKASDEGVHFILSVKK